MTLGRVEPLEKGMETHSSMLAWRIPMDRGAWRSLNRKDSDMTSRLNIWGTLSIELESALRTPEMPIHPFE